MAKTSNKPVYTPRFGSQSSLKPSQKHELREKSAKVAADARLRPAGVEQTGNSGMSQKAKRVKPAKVKLFSVAKERPATIKSIPEQSRNVRPKPVTEKEEIPRRKESELPNTQRGWQTTADAFSFPGPGTPPSPVRVSQQSAVKQAVLRTIAKMLEENRDLRRRLAVCRKERDTGTGADWIGRL